MLKACAAFSKSQVVFEAYELPSTIPDGMLEVPAGPKYASGEAPYLVEEVLCSEGLRLS